MKKQTNFTRPIEFINKNCPVCDNLFKISKHSKEMQNRKFCSSSCSAKFNNKNRIVSDEQKIKTRNSLLKSILPNICMVCGKDFLPPRKNKKRKTCSHNCLYEHRIKNIPIPKNIGGYREGSGRSKHGYYKGIYCGSTYELCWVIYSLDHKIKFKRFPSFLEKDGLKYYPDFLLDDGKTIIETKGYEREESVRKKTKLAESFGYTVKVLRKNDLKYIFDYVILTYKTKKFETLYDDKNIKTAPLVFETSISG